jgi:translation elongation factor EF-1beta
LREDQITSSCALEYIDLLDPLSNRDKIKELLDIAIKSSGRECDILQLCAISYLKIDEITSAVKLLKYLVNENYNETINAQLLSSIYVSGYMDNNIKDFLIDYKMLQKKVNSELLFPLPEDSNINIDELKDNFVLKQRDLLFKKYSYVLRNYYEKCIIMFNKAIPVPYEDKYYPDSFFSDQYEYREERFNKYKELFSNRNKVHDFITRLAYSNFDLGYLEILNKMVNDIESIIVDETEDKSDIVGKLSRNIESKIIEQRYKINHLKDKMNIQFGIEEFKLLFDLSLDVFTKEFYKMLINEVKNHIVQLKSMSDFSKEETILREFCIKQEIPEFKTSLSLSDEKYTDSSNNEIYF